MTKPVARGKLKNMIHNVFLNWKRSTKGNSFSPKTDRNWNAGSGIFSQPDGVQPTIQRSIRQVSSAAGMEVVARKRPGY